LEISQGNRSAETESREDVTMPRACGGNRSAVVDVQWWHGIPKARAAKCERRGRGGAGADAGR
jgi:hypothetical protein